MGGKEAWNIGFGRGWQRLRRVKKSVAECIRRCEESDGIRALAVSDRTRTRHLRNGVDKLFELRRVCIRRQLETERERRIRREGVREDLEQWTKGGDIVCGRRFACDVGTRGVQLDCDPGLGLVVQFGA